MAIRLSNLLVIYFCMGAVVWGGGAINWDQTGLSQYFLEDATDNSPVEVNDSVQSEVEGIKGPSLLAQVGAFGGPLVLIWDFLIKLVAVMFWPVTMSVSFNAPPEVVVLLGGGVSVMFVAAFLVFVRRSA